MTTEGWIVMIFSIVLVVGLVIYCFTKLLTSPETSSERMHAPLDIDTRDRGT